MAKRKECHMKKRKCISNWNDVPLCVDLPWVIAILAVSEITATKLLKNGDLLGVKVGREWRITKDELQRYLREGSANLKNGEETA